MADGRYSEEVPVSSLLVVLMIFTINFKVVVLVVWWTFIQHFNFLIVHWIFCRLLVKFIKHKSRSHDWMLFCLFHSLRVVLCRDKRA